MLKTRLSVAMVSLVILTAGAVGWTSYHYLEAATLPGELKRLAAQAARTPA